MANVYSTVRIRAGLYISGDSQFKIQRRRDQLSRRWIWDVYHLEEGQYVWKRKFRTLKVAREWAGTAVPQPIFW